MPFGLKPFYSIKVLKEGGGTISDAEVQILGGTGYKLPSDAEWTWGCAAGAKTNYHFGDEEKDLPTYAWFLANSSDRPHQVGEKLSNQFGLLDIHGNVHEWNEDHLISKDGSPSRTNRGGTFHHPASTGRVGTRPLSPPWYRTSHIGLRIARAATVEATPPPLAKAPFDATQAKAHQEAWAKYLGTTVETVNSVGAKMILIPPGEFLMGSTDEQVAAALKVAEEIKSGSTIIRSIEKAESPQHKVIITKPLLMGTTEVTLSQFKKFTAATSYQTEAEKKELKAKASPPTATTPGQSPPKPIQTYLAPGYVVGDNSPAAMITWNDAVAYCNWLSEQEQLEPCYRPDANSWLLVPSKNGYRLPTEAEWEYACRAGTTTQFSFGDDQQQLDQYGWYNKTPGVRSHDVGTKLPNGFGLFDMHGNLQEWCSDYINENWYAASPPNDPNGPSAGSLRVIRGGSWHDSASYCRSATRYSLSPSSHSYSLGFRCVRTLDASATVASDASMTPPVVTPAPELKHVGPAPALAKAPFDAAQARAHQEAWAKHLGTEVVKPNSIGMHMTLIPPGEFLMGSSDADITLALKIAEETKLDKGGVDRIQEERPQHSVRITKPFRLAAHEVTIGQFAKFVEQVKYKTQAEEFGGNSSTVKPEEVKPDSLKLNWQTPGQTVTDDCPVTQVSWNDAVAFCNWLSGQEQLAPCYQRNGDTWTLLPKANGYRLPTEAEWEYACRAGTATQYSLGDDWKELDKYGWSKNNSGNRPHAVGSLPANEYGLHDMHGNVWEWCQDWYDGKWFEKSPSDNPLGPGSASFRAYRGGSWNVMPAYCRSSSRGNITPSYRNYDRGFRVAIGLVGAPSSTASVTPPPLAKVEPSSPADFSKVPPLLDCTGPNGADAKTVRESQIAWAKYLGEPSFEKTMYLDKDKKVAIEMVLVPPGKYWRGSPNGVGEANEHPQAVITLDQPRWVGKYEVTQKQYEAVMGKNPSLSNKKGAETASYPVEQVGHDDSLEFAEKATSASGVTFRLLTEAEWEYACRAGTRTKYYIGDDDISVGEIAIYDVNSGQKEMKGQPWKVGCKKPNSFGLYDMSGNVWEWCADWYAEKYDTTSVINPPGPTSGSERVHRGGSFEGFVGTCRSSFRGRRDPNFRRGIIGFRISAEAKNESAKVNSNADRAAAEKLLPFVGELGLRLPDGNTVKVAKGKSLPAGPFELVAIIFHSGIALPDDFETSVLLPAVANLRSVGIIKCTFRSRPIRDRELALLSDLPLAATITHIEGGITLKPDTIDALLKFPRLTSVTCDASGASDALFGRLVELPRLSTLAFHYGSGIGPKGADAVSKLPLQRFRMSDLNAQAVRRVCELSAALPGLIDLTILNSDLHDEDLPKLAGSKTLAALSLEGTKISDVGLEHLRGLASLRQLNLKNTAVTEAGAKHLADALPKCEIVYGTGNGTTIKAREKDPADDAKKFQTEWAAKLKLPVELKSPTGIEMVVIPPGEGIDKPFLMGKYEVTQGEFEKVMGYNPSAFSANGKRKDKVTGMDTARFPVESVNWFDAVEFCNKLSEKDGLKPYYGLTGLERKGQSIEKAEVKVLGGSGFHLPMDKEWTWACAAGAKLKFHFGDRDEELAEFAWFQENSVVRSHMVGEKKPNAFGLFDMHGNVREWNEEMLTNAVKGAPERVPRGGYWNSPAARCSVDNRGQFGPADRDYSIGFRVARALTEAEAEKVTGLKPAAEPAKIDNPAERKGAAWILSVKGECDIETADGKQLKLKDGAALPNEPFAVVGFNISKDGFPIDDGALGNLAGCSRVREASIEFGLPGKITAKGLGSLANCSNLESLFRARAR